MCVRPAGSGPRWRGRSLTALGGRDGRSRPRAFRLWWCRPAAAGGRVARLPEAVVRRSPPSQRAQQLSQAGLPGGAQLRGASERPSRGHLDRSRLVRERILERILVEPAAPSCRSPAVAAPRAARCARRSFSARARSRAIVPRERSVPSRTAPHTPPRPYADAWPAAPRARAARTCSLADGLRESSADGLRESSVQCYLLDGYKPHSERSS